MAQTLWNVHHRYALLWFLGVETGLRIGDLLRIRVRDVGQFLWLEEQKTKRIRGIFMMPDILEDIYFYVYEHRLNPDEFLFFSSSTRKYKPITRQWAHRVIARTSKIRGHRHIGSHSMRKIYACELYRSTGKIEAVQEALGHRSVATTFFYIRDVLEDKKLG